MFKYKYITAGNKTIAISSYAGKAVRGVAKCDPKDTFDPEKGKDLATARCANKIAKKRLKRAEKKLAEAKRELATAVKFHTQMEQYYARAIEEYATTKEAVETFEGM